MTFRQSLRGGAAFPGFRMGASSITFAMLRLASDNAPRPGEICSPGEIIEFCIYVWLEARKAAEMLSKYMTKNNPK